MCPRDGNQPREHEVHRLPNLRRAVRRPVASAGADAPGRSPNRCWRHSPRRRRSELSAVPLGPPRRALQRGMASRRFTARLLVLAGVFGLGLGTTAITLRTEPFGVMVGNRRPERLMDVGSNRAFAMPAWSVDLARAAGLAT